jgi:DNA gyrase/topoisomerase IV subunit A
MTEVEWEPSHQRILVSGLPDADALEVLVEKLRDLIMDRQISGVSGMSNLSTDDESRFTVELRPDADPQAVVAAIRRHALTAE